MAGEAGAGRIGRWEPQRSERGAPDTHVPPCHAHATRTRTQYGGLHCLHGLQGRLALADLVECSKSATSSPLCSCSVPMLTDMCTREARQQPSSRADSGPKRASLDVMGGGDSFRTSTHRVGPIARHQLHAEWLSFARRSSASADHLLVDCPHARPLFVARRDAPATRVQVDSQLCAKRAEPGIALLTCRDEYCAPTRALPRGAAC
mmetsp:Transcript_12649/g.29185  ORF Transcript_12649/g.29185 Transcript_12649/m.29185 type:complete len:206 (-) Transcript_12649:60-677(-)